MIADEIQSGLGRTGRTFACEHEDVVPDVYVLGKALGGGIVPLAAVIARGDLDVAPELSVGHYTHEKNPLLTTAGLTTVRIIEEEGLAERAQELGERTMACLNEMAGRHRAIGHVRGRGLLIGIELVTDRATKEPARALAQAVQRRALAHGLSLKVSGKAALVLSPPLVIPEADLDRAVAILDDCLAEAAA
jgi:4-aminobutyrate aminotransferase